MEQTLLAQFKITIGDFNQADPQMDTYYNNFLNMAIADLTSDDISVEQLNGPLGKALTVLYAEALMKKQDIPSNNTITLLRNKVATLTKGERYGN